MKLSSKVWSRSSWPSQDVLNSFAWRGFEMHDQLYKAVARLLVVVQSPRADICVSVDALSMMRSRTSNKSPDQKNTDCRQNFTVRTNGEMV